MGRLYFLVFGSALIFILGCSTNNPVAVQPTGNDCYKKDEQKWAVCDQERHYTFWYPSSIEKGEWRNKDVHVYTYDFPMNADERKIFDNNYGERSSSLYSEASTCPTSFTGTSKTTVLPNANGKAAWGKVDEARFGAYEADPVPFCRPPIVYEDFCGEAGVYEDPETGIDQAYEDCMKTRRPHLSVAAYAFCSEKNGRTVAICISQVTDNPALAEQIFKTFRWTK